MFGTPNGPALNLHASVAIVRHAKVKGGASPYDGNWSYWATRRGHHPGVSNSLARLLKLKLPIAPEPIPGCDGDFTEIELGEYWVESKFRWWSCPPEEWQELDQCVYKLLGLLPEM